MESIKISDTLDITDVVCPVTFARTLLKLEDMQVGDVLEVFLNEGSRSITCLKASPMKAIRLFYLKKPVTGTGCWLKEGNRS